MSSDSSLYTTTASASHENRNLAITEIVLFTLIHLAQLPVRYMQEWRYWHHNKKQRPARCFFYSWWSMVGLLAQMRIVGAAMVLATSRPSKAMLIAEKVMQNVSLSPLLFEVSLVLLRCGQAGEYGPGNSKFSKMMRFTLHAFRFPIFIAIVLAVVGECIDIHPLAEAGSVVLVVTFTFVCGLVAWLAINSHSILPVPGYRGVLLTFLAFPFLVVRIIYFLLLEYGPSKFSPTSGNVGILIGMSLTMEIITVAVLLTTRSIVEPIWSVENDFRPI